MHTESLALPIVGARPELQPLLQDALVSMSHAKSEVPCIREQLRALLRDKLPSGSAPNLPRTAGRLRWVPDSAPSCPIGLGLVAGS
ncbi:hypothetical protein [Enhygromyxa salina]|uniref:Uncharacterized protein n=1 Tax=Enhygromyxa salina TaxID=215803 RepID=A0A2S9YSQ5_9BACT|nr:hypothetical protein [Enhygromyxa salina]PRQ08100.1 hypothetical protein ENSA7_20720 [Enhygromyxa salina]